MSPEGFQPNFSWVLAPPTFREPICSGLINATLLRGLYGVLISQLPGSNCYCHVTGRFSYLAVPWRVLEDP